MVWVDPKLITILLRRKWKNSDRNVRESDQALIGTPDDVVTPIPDEADPNDASSESEMEELRGDTSEEALIETPANAVTPIPA